MLRTVELGRAVITATETSLELWLTTWITLSPRQNCANLEQLSNSALIHFLTSGDAWVHQSEPMHLISDLSVRGEPIDPCDIETLAAGIVDAPAWDQLNILPSLPLSQMQSNNQSIHINLSPSTENIDDKFKKCHRLVAKLVPDSIPTLALHSVHFSLVISENMSKSSVQRQRKSQSETTFTHTLGTDSFKGDSANTLSMLPNERLEVDGYSDEEILFTTTIPLVRKRKRSVTMPNGYIQTSDSPCEISHQCHGTNPPSSASVPSPSILKTPQLRLLSHMLDAAVRFSALNSLKGSASGLKVKANTFTTRLADVAPIVWRPGFLSALSQRACLAPTLSSSLNRIASKAQTMSFPVKTGILFDNPPPATYLGTGTSIMNHDTDSPSTKCTSVYTYKYLLSKPVTGLMRPFCVLTPQSGNHLGDNTLESQVEESTHRLTPMR